MEWSPGAPGIPPQRDPDGVSAALSEAYDLVGLAQNAARDLTDAANNILAHSSVNTLPAILDTIFPTVTAPPLLHTANPPTYKDIPWSDPTPPTPFQGNLDVQPLLPGIFNGVAPTLNFDGKPGAPTDLAPNAPSVDFNFVYPDVSIALPAVPSLLQLTVTPFGGITIPDFSAEVPVFTVPAPGVIPYVEGAMYTSALLDQTKADIQRALTDGTWTGLSANAETALWDRAREREYRQQADALEALEKMEALGFAFPPGVFIDARLKVQTETNNSIAALSREIMIKQAEMQLDNVQKCRALAVQVESKFIDYVNLIAQRSFEAVKMVNEVTVQQYNAQVEAYRARVQAYHSSALVYEAQIKGALAQVDAYKAQIEAERVKAEINSTLVQQYKVQVDASLAQIEIFKGKISIIQTQAQIEKLKIEAYQAEIQGYAAKINVFASQVEAYRASVSAEATKQQAYATSVQAYSAQVDAQVKVASAKIEEFKGLLSAKTEEIEAYKANVGALTARVNAAATFNQALVEQYKADVTATASYNEVLVKEWEAVINADTRLTEIAIKAAETQQQLALTARQIMTEATKGAAQVLGQLGAAALNAVHYSNSVSSSYSSSASNSASYSESLSASV